MRFSCNICSGTRISNNVHRGDGKNVLFCADCEMGVVEAPPADTSIFYRDGYYGVQSEAEAGYHDYSFTAEHSLLWTRVLIQEVVPTGRILDVGCADGFLLRHLDGDYQRYGIEVNRGAAAVAAKGGVQVIARDIFDPAVTKEFDSFDAVTSIATFEHVLDFRRAVETCLEALKPEGILIFEVPLISETRDNKDWYHSSYEHIFYPTLRGLERLFSTLPDYRFKGFETNIVGFSSTYIGIASRDRYVFEITSRLLDVMTAESVEGLADNELRLNLAYNVMHCFRPTPERVLALPILLEKFLTFNLAKRLTQLWYSDSVRGLSASWNEQQAKNWKDAYDNLAMVLQHR